MTNPVAMAQADAARREAEGDLNGAIEVWKRFAEGEYDRDAQLHPEVDAMSGELAVECGKREVAP